MTERPAHEDEYPSQIAMEAAVELEIHSALGRVQTQTIGKIIQRAIDKAREAERVVDTKPQACPEYDWRKDPMKNGGNGY